MFYHQYLYLSVLLLFIFTLLIVIHKISRFVAVTSLVVNLVATVVLGLGEVEIILFALVPDLC